MGVFRLKGQPKRDDGMIFGSCKAIHPGFPIWAASKLKGQPKRDDGIIVRSCKASAQAVSRLLSRLEALQRPVNGGVIMLMASINVLPNRPARMSHYGECDIDSKGAGKVTDPQQLTGRAHGSGSGGHVDGSERTPHQAHPRGLQQGGSSRTRSRSSWTPSAQRDTRAAKVRGPASC